MIVYPPAGAWLRSAANPANCNDATGPQRGTDAPKTGSGRYVEQNTLTWADAVNDSNQYRPSGGQKRDTENPGETHMADREHDLTRRGFVKALSGVAALEASGILAATDRSVEGAVATTPPASTWSPAWRPETPKRLSDTTRELARRAISGEHGRSMANATFSLPPEQAKGLPQSTLYARACLLVAEQAPLRILPGERIVGAATLLEGPHHRPPLIEFGGTSHTTIGFHKVLKIGYRGLRRQIDERLAHGDLDAKAITQLQAMRQCLDAAGIWHKRHMVMLGEMEASADDGQRTTCRQVREALAPVPENPPETFHEAVQSLWFMYAFQRLCGNWSGIGRIDEMLGPYLERDLAAGRITLDEARELLAHFWIKGTRVDRAPSCIGPAAATPSSTRTSSSAASTPTASEVTNEVTYLVLDIVEELHISDFPIAVRLNRRHARSGCCGASPRCSGTAAASWRSTTRTWSSTAW